jgi:NADPH:quinone reductase-like Zn-dependent oxidoreductase
MSRRRKWFLIVLAVLGLAATAGGLALSHNGACETAVPAAAPETGAGSKMLSVRQRCYGAPETLQFEHVARPALADDAVLVKVHAASVNPLDWHYMRGEPYVMRLESGIGKPSDPRFGVDFSGTVEAVGAQVKSLKPGDQVFGAAAGAFAEYVTVRESRAVASKPTNISFEQAAAVPIAGLTALQALRDKAGVAAGQRVLINGASGGVGTFAVQIAKSMGAYVTGVCSTRNVDLVRSLGADMVIDYSKADFTQSTQKYDVVIDNVGNRSLLDVRKAMTRNGVYVAVGGSSDGRWIGPLWASLKALMLQPFVSQEVKMILAETSAADLSTLGDLMANGKLTPAIDRRYPLRQLPEAIAYLETGRARGKVVIDIAR